MTAAVNKGRRQAMGQIVGRMLALLLALGLGLGALSGCQAMYANHGYAPDDAALAKITVGKDTRDTVAATLGPPSVEGLLNDVGWFYVQSRYKTQGILAPQEIDRQVVAITFTDKGVVANVERFGLDRGQIVPISRRVTTEPVKGQSFLRQLFGNLGAFQASNFIKP
jgi:outer membrane protein assembly factor BamE (lipoprotein component of BamABCDE complex)